MNSKTKKHYYWVIKTTEPVARYVEVIIWWGTEREYGLMYNIRYAKVWKTNSYSPPRKRLMTFIKTTGIDAELVEVPEEAYCHYKKYEKYFSGKMTAEEEKQWEQEEHVDEEWKKFVDDYILQQESPRVISTKRSLSGEKFAK